MPVDTKDILYMLAKEFSLEREKTPERLILQKTIYLLQAYGLKFGYGFSWYKYGPYSQDLVQDAYTVLRSEKQVYEDRTSALSFARTSKQRFDRFREICGDALNDPGKLELIASVHFARTTWYPDVDEKAFISLFKRHKSFLYGGTRVEDNMVRKALIVVKNLKTQAT